MIEWSHKSGRQAQHTKGEPLMKTQVIETQLNGKTRTYQIDGPKFESVVDFWDYLMVRELIEGYTILRVPKFETGAAK